MTVLGCRAEKADFTDPIQGVRGRFLIGPGPRLELLAAIPGRDTLDPWLKARVKLYHLAYEVDSIHEAIAHLVARRARHVSGPVPAVAFDGRSIAFLMLPNLLLIELIEAPKAEAPSRSAAGADLAVSGTVGPALPGPAEGDDAASGRGVW